MKLCNINVNGEIHLGIGTENGVADATAAGFPLSMGEVIRGAGRGELERLAGAGLPAVDGPVFENVVDRPGKLVCVGLNYRAHADGLNDAKNFSTADCPILFSKYADSLAPSGAAVELPAWEKSYDYEAELVIVMGSEAWNVGEAEAMEHVFGYTCGNDLSCRDAQKRTSQWLVGKAMPGFGPCGPFIVTADALDVDGGVGVRSYVNGELRQNGNTRDMIFSCARIISYASKYIRLCPGDLIFTGTPSGVALEQREDKRVWIEPGDRIDVEIDGIGVLTNTMV